MKKFIKSQTALQIVACAVISTFVIAGVVSAASTIGANITTAGTLEVTGASTLTGAVTTSAAATVGTDLTVTSGARVGTGSSGGHITALADDSLLIEGESEFDGIAWFDGSLRASTTLMVTGAATFYNNVTIPAAYSLDTTSAGALNIGTTTATSINIGKTTKTTTVKGLLNVDEAATFDSTLKVGANDWGTGATGIALTATGAASEANARVNANLTGGVAASGSYSSMAVTSAQTGDTSLFGSWNELYVTGANLTGSANYAGLWGHLETSGTVTSTDAGDYMSGIAGSILIPTGFTNNTAVSGVRVDSKIATSGVTNNGRFSAFEADKSSDGTFADWDYGLYLNDVTTDIRLQNGETISNATDGTIALSGIITGTGLTVSGNAAVTGNLTVGGNFTLGDAAADTLTVYGATILPSLTATSSTPFVLEGATDDDFETTIAVTNPTADNTITLPNGTGTVYITGGTDVTVADGGTGASTLTDGGILLGSGTDAVTPMAVLTDGQIVVGDGTTDPVALAAFTSSTGQLKHESGGLEADVSAYSGLVKITGGAASAVTVTTAGEALLDDANAAAQLVTLGVTSDAAELNILDGVTAAAAELNYVDITTLGTAASSKALTLSSGGVLTLADAQLVDFGAIVHNDAAAQGLRLPNSAGAPTAITANPEGHIAWDATNDLLYVSTGAGWASTFNNTASANTWTDNQIYTFAGDEDIVINSAASAAVDIFKLNITSTSVDAIRGIVIDGLVGGTEPVDAGIQIIGSDTDAGDIMTSGLILTGTITTALDASAANITTALKVDANDIVGTTGLINYTNFDVDAAGNITVAAAQGLDTNAAGALELGVTNATSIDIGVTTKMTTVKGTLNVDEAVTMDTTLNVAGNVDINGMATTTAATGAIDTEGGLTVGGAINYALAATADNQAYTLAVDITSLTDGAVVIFKMPGANSGGVSTLNVNSLGAKKMLKGSDNATQITLNDLIANGSYMAVYNSTLDTAAGAWVILSK